MLREELGRSGDVSIGVDDLPILNQAINRVYQLLYLQHDWPFLRRVFPKISLSAGQRLYGFPTDLNIERVEEVVVWQNGLPTPVVRGIAFDEYAEFDSEATTPERADPVLAWDVRDSSGTPQIEVWPIPTANDQDLQIIGIRSLSKLVNDADIVLLDDNLVVLFAAARILARQKSEDAPIGQAEAAAFFQILKGRSSKGGSRRTRIGAGPSPHESPPRSRATVRIGS